MAKTYSMDSSKIYWSAGMMLTAALLFSGTAFADSDKHGSSASTGVQVQIGAQGDALVRGAKVTAVSDTQVKADTSLGSSVLNWIVKTDSDTDFSATKGGESGMEEIEVGDTISFRGAIDQSVAGLTVRAKQVKDWTSVETRASLSGIVTSINSTLDSFTVRTAHGTTTVETDSSTEFTEDGESASFADIVLDAKVKLVGFLNSTSSVFSATSVEINDHHDWRGWFHGKAWLKFWHKED